MSFSIAVLSPGAIPDRDTLIDAIQKWLDREGDTVVTDMIPMFIALAEAEFNRQLRCPDMENTAPLMAAADEDTPLPSDYLAMRAIYVDGSPDRPLKAISPSAIRQNYDGTTGTPVAYALVSGVIRLAPPPASQLLLRMDYWARIEPLSVLSPANWLLLGHPGAYLFMALAFAEDYLDNDVKAQKYLGWAQTIVQDINKAGRSDQYGAGALVPSTVNQVSGSKC
jgi:hypothetical protein